MRLGAFIDPIAEFLLGLRRVSATHWLLRLVGIAAMLLALVGTLPSGLFVHIGTGIITLAVTGSLLVQALRPDSDVGLLAPAAIILALAGQGDLSLLRQPEWGSPCCCRTSPSPWPRRSPRTGCSNGRPGSWAAADCCWCSRSASSRDCSSSPCPGCTYGSWMLVLGILGAIGLFVTVMPRST